jgi:hypothetical protein
MGDMERRLNRVISAMSGNEAIAASLEDDAAGELLSWGHSMATHIVEETTGMDDETAEEKMAPRLRAVRLMLRSIGRWVGEAGTLDDEARRALWDRAGEQSRILFCETFEFPSMDEAVGQLPEGADALQTITWLRTYIEEKNSLG